MATTDFTLDFVDRRYGKNYVRLLAVQRNGDLHTIKEIEVNTALTLNNTRDFLHGDNSDIIATDSQKNTVYILAKKFGVVCIENFALLLCSHFLDKYRHVDRACVEIKQKPWKRILRNGKEHNHAFVQEGGATRSCQVTQSRGQPALVQAGLSELQIMKTTQSAFVNFVNDEFRTLPDMSDRVFCTVVDAKWSYKRNSQLHYCSTWNIVKECILEAFAGPADKGIFSPSVQKTLYDTVKLVFTKIPEVEEMSLELPNVHAYEFDLGRFPKLGLKNEGEIFQPSTSPSGNIKATLRRSPVARL